MTIFADRVWQTTETTGTGTYQMATTVAGYRDFLSACGNGQAAYYIATDNVDWEIGIGTVTAGSPATISRDTILLSSNGNAAVSWGVGTKQIFCGLPASKVVHLDQNGVLQNLTAALSALSALTPAADRIPYFTGSGSAALMRYETGTWTPVIAPATPGTWSVSYATQLGYYLRIGKLMFVRFQLNFTPTVGTGSGDLQIGGLPAIADGPAMGATFCSIVPNNINLRWVWPGAPSQLAVSVGGGVNYMILTALKSGTAAANLSPANLTDGQSHSIRAAGWYELAASV